MKHIDFYLDFISPYAWLAFEQLPRTLEGLSYSVSYHPVLLGALLKPHANPGPAGIPPKRDWTYRHVTWLGQSTGIGLQMPTQHPFMPTPLLRLALACSEDGRINRYVARTLLQHVWQGGLDANDPARLEALATQLTLRHAPTDDAVKAMLRSNTAQAEALGVFGVPAFVVDGHVFWGFDSLPMLRAFLADDPWFASHWNDPAQVTNGLS
jgi:2-hydroxychromene-2-carboxylate isomerase